MNTIEDWSVNFTELKFLKWTLFKDKIKQEDVFSTVIFVMKHLKDVINDSLLFEKIQRVNKYLNEKILKKWIDEKEWTEDS